MVVASYCRVSTKSSDQINSYENQQSYFDREIKAKGHKLYQIYADKGLTGTELNNRPEFEKMLYDAGVDIVNFKQKERHTNYEASDREPLFNEIWIKNTSRFARNTLSSRIIDVLRRKKVNVFFMEQGINTNNMTQDLTLSLFQVFDAQDSKDKSKKVKSGIDEGVRNGVVKTNGKIYGYKYIQVENRLEIIEEEADIIRKIFELYEEEKGIRQIINYLKDKNLKTRNGRDFCKTTIRRILDNEKYAGLNNPLKYDMGIVFNKLSYAHIKDEYATFESDKIPAIINKELFYKCKELLKTKVNYNNQIGIFKGTSKYSSLLYCGRCGNIYHSNQDRGRIFYNCSNKKMHGKHVCNNPNISEKAVDEYIENLTNGEFNRYLDGVMSIYEKKVFIIINNLFNKIDNKNDAYIESLKNEINDNDEQIAGLYKLYGRKTTNIDILEKQLETIELKNEELKAIYKESIRSNEDIYKDIIKVYNGYNQLKTRTSNKQIRYTPDDILKRFSSIIVKLNSDNEIDLIAQIGCEELDEYQKLYENMQVNKIYERENENILSKEELIKKIENIPQIYLGKGI